MAHNEMLTRRVRDALSHVPHVEEKRMFRGVAFMVDGKMCITAGDDKIMCRINPSLHDEALTRDGCQTVIMRGRSYKGYVYVNESAIKSKKDFDYWIGLALEFNKIARSSKRKK